MPNFRSSLLIKDGKGSVKATQFYGSAPPEMALGDMGAHQYGFFLALAPLIGGKLLSSTFSIFEDYSVDTDFPAAAIESDVENIGLLHMYNGFFPNVKPVSPALPAANKAKFPGGILNLADTDVAAFTSLLSVGVAGITWYDARGNGWSSCTDGVLTMRHNGPRKRRNRRG